MKGPWPSWAARETVDGRTLPPAPMPPELAATVDPAKNEPGPVDDPAELARRVRTLTESRRNRPRYPKEETS